MRGVTVQPMVRLEPIELVIGSWVDSRFGPVVVFGAGGTLGDVYQDRSLALPPFDLDPGPSLAGAKPGFTRL